MAWITPKTDWDLSYRWDKDDINRIQDNLLYILDYIGTHASKLYTAPTLIPLNTNKTYASMFYASEMNNIETDLERLNNATVHKSTSTAPTFSPNGPGPSYEEFNRIESLTLIVKNGIEGNVEILPKLSFTLGNMRGVKI